MIEEQEMVDNYFNCFNCKNSFFREECTVYYTISVGIREKDKNEYSYSGYKLREGVGYEQITFCENCWLNMAGPDYSFDLKDLDS